MSAFLLSGCLLAHARPRLLRHADALIRAVPCKRRMGEKFLTARDAPKFELTPAKRTWRANGTQPGILLIAPPLHPAPFHETTAINTKWPIALAHGVTFADFGRVRPLRKSPTAVTIRSRRFCKSRSTVSRPKRPNDSLLIFLLLILFSCMRD